MGKTVSPEFLYVCEGHGYMNSENCPGHAIRVSHCRSSDTVSITIDGKVEMVLSDEGFEALKDAVNWKNW